MTTQLTILNSMAGADLEPALTVHKKWNLQWLDLRDGIYGHWLATLDLETAKRARAAIDKSGLNVYCLSTATFFDEIGKGERHFREKYLDRFGHLIELAHIFQPKLIRIIAALLPSRQHNENAIDVIASKFPWVFALYREAIDRITDAGFRVTIENEAYKCVLSQPKEFVDFFALLDRSSSVGLTWDVQNQWATGAFPTLEIYETLKPLIQYYHVKGGQYEGSSDTLRWNVALEDANWPVIDITSRVVADGVSPVICINPPGHGAPKPGYNYEDITKRDIDFLRYHVPGIE